MILARGTESIPLGWRLLVSLVLIHTTATALWTRSPETSSPFRRSDISGYDSCNSSETKIIQEAYHDMLRLTQNVHPFLQNVSIVNGIPQTTNRQPGELEKRYFGDDGSFGSRRQLIHAVFRDSANWAPTFLLDWVRRKQIHVSCADEQNSTGQSCSTARVNNGTAPFAYAFEGNGHRIVFCDAFFGLPSLSAQKTFLDNSATHQKDLLYMGSTGQVFFRSMIHLSILQQSAPTNITDQLANPVDKLGEVVYGPVAAELLAERFANYSSQNADNYAWYATAAWFSQFYGTPSVPAGVADSPLTNSNLKILPLGDSITFGYRSSDGNGYRGPLEDILKKNNNQVEMIGSVRSGEMADNRNEGHNGAIITEIASFTNAYAERPNVVLLHAGTNDLNQDLNVTTAPQRLDDLIGQLVDGCPGAVVLVACVVPIKNVDGLSRVRTYNEHVKARVAARSKKGEHVLVVDMPALVTTNDLIDGLHPTDEGYGKMAQMWAIGLKQAADKGWIVEDVQVQQRNVSADQVVSLGIDIKVPYMYFVLCLFVWIWTTHIV